MSILFALSRQPKLFFQLLVTVVRTVPFNLFLDITLLDSQLYSGWLILGKVANASLGDFSMNDISYDELVKFNAFVVYKCST